MAEDLPQARHVDLQNVSRFLRPFVAPKLLDEAVRRDDMVRVEAENRQNSPLLRAAERKRRVMVPDLERAKEAAFHRVGFLAEPVGPFRPRVQRRFSVLKGHAPKLTVLTRGGAR